MRDDRRPRGSLSPDLLEQVAATPAAALGSTRDERGAAYCAAIVKVFRAHPQPPHTPAYPSAARFVSKAFAVADLDNAALPAVYIGVVMGHQMTPAFHDPLRALPGCAPAQP